MPTTKIYAAGNYFIFEIVGVAEPIQDGKSVVRVWLKDDATDLYHIQSPLIGNHDVLLSNIQDETGTPYPDRAAWETFYENNTGFDPASVSGASLLNDLTDVNQDFTSATGAITDDGKIPFYDFAAKKFLTDENITHGTVAINGKTSVLTGTIAKGLPVYISDFDADLNVVELADADGAGTFPCIGFTGELFNDSDSKHVITFGKITGINTTNATTTLNPNGETWVQGQSLFLSTTSGGLTKDRPMGATEIQRIAQVIKANDATGGQLFIFNTARTAGLPNLSEGNVWEGDANSHPVETSKLAEIYKTAIGSIIETISVTVTEDIGVVYLNLEKQGGGDVNLVFSTGIELFDTTPIAQIELTLGTDTVPQENYIYIPISTKVLTISPTDYPATEHIKIAHAIIPSAARVAANGTYGLHVSTNHLSAEGDNGHIDHISANIRAQFATWLSGVIPSYNVTTNGGSLDSLDYAITSGIVRQLHKLTYPAHDTGTGSKMYVVNDFTTAYKEIADLNQIDADAAGLTLRNNFDRAVFIVWGVISENAIDCKSYINSPNGKYAGGGIGFDSAAINDTQQTANYTIPSSFKGTGFLIAKLVVKYSSVSGGTLEVLSHDELLGNNPSIIRGGVTPTINEFPTSLFKLLDSIDSTKRIDFDLSGLTTGADRTLIVQDKDGTIAYIPESVTNAAMLVLTPAAEGAQVYNTTWKSIYTYDGDVWLTDQLVKAVNRHATTMQEGNPAFQDTSTDNGVQLSSNDGSVAIWGIVKDIYGTPTPGATSEFVTIAVSGEHNVLCNGTVNRGEVISQSGTLGEADASPTTSAGNFAIARSSKGAAGTALILSIIQPTERF